MRHRLVRQLISETINMIKLMDEQGFSEEVMVVNEDCSISMLKYNVDILGRNNWIAASEKFTKFAILHKREDHWETGINGVFYKDNFPVEIAEKVLESITFTPYPKEKVIRKKKKST